MDDTNDAVALQLQLEDLRALMEAKSGKAVRYVLCCITTWSTAIYKQPNITCQSLRHMGPF